ncbi:MAG: kelch repeat-containing protein [Kofleriaceae bacterium]
MDEGHLRALGRAVRAVASRPSLVVAGRAGAVAVLVAACGAAPLAPDADLGPWHRGPDLPDARIEPAVAVRGGRLVVAGGFGSNLAIDRRVAEFDPATATWQVTAPLPVAWTHAQLIGVGPRLYLLGGLAGTMFTPRGEAFVDDGAGWRSVAPLPAGAERGGAAVAATATTIYLIGGGSATAALASAWAYDVAADAWQALPSLPSPRSHAVAAVAGDGTVIVAGGLATLDASQPLTEVLALAPGATAWSRRAPMPTARGGCAAGVVGDELVCAGGEAGDHASDAVEAYQLTADRWRTLPALPTPRAGTQGAAIDATLYVPGGAARLAYEPEATLLYFRP